MDGCFIKLSTGQQILAATGRVGNNTIYPIAFGVVDKEDTKSWTWFLTELKAAIGGESGRFGFYTIISDRQKVLSLLLLILVIDISSHSNNCLLVVHRIFLVLVNIHCSLLVDISSS